MIKNNWIVKAENGIFKKFISINQARIYYDELKRLGLKPKINKLTKK